MSRGRAKHYWYKLLDGPCQGPHTTTDLAAPGKTITARHTIEAHPVLGFAIKIELHEYRRLEGGKGTSQDPFPATWVGLTGTVDPPPLHSTPAK